MKHFLKTVNPHFTAVWRGLKKFEIRENDRDFQVGDRVHLQEYFPETDTYSGREFHCEITYILKEFKAIKPGYVVFSFVKKLRINK